MCTQDYTWDKRTEREHGAKELQLYMAANKYDVQRLKAKAQTKWMAWANSRIHADGFLEDMRQAMETLPPHDSAFRKAIVDLLLANAHHFATWKQLAEATASSGAGLSTILEGLLCEVSQFRRIKVSKSKTTRTSSKKTKRRVTVSAI